MGLSERIPAQLQVAHLSHTPITSIAWSPPTTPSSTATNTTMIGQEAEYLVKIYNSDVEKSNPFRTPHRLAKIRYLFLNTYRRLFSIVFVTNLCIFIWYMTKGRNVLQLINVAAANMVVCGLARQPLVINSLFIVFCTIPRSAPLRIRRLMCKIFHYGGVHSGCGVASFMWYAAFVATLTSSYRLGQSSTRTTVVLVLAYSILILLLLIITVAYPGFRMRLHNHFELSHRYLGWLVVILFWALVLLFASAERPSMALFLITTPAFWLLIMVTFAIIQPWSLLRKVPVTAEYLSSHAIRLHFSHTTVKFGQGLSLSKNPYLDWHAFASFPDPESNGESFSCLISKAGDWTNDIIQNPPTHLWKRGVPIYGFGYVMRVFSRIVVVTTGSGIGPCLSFLGDDNRPKMKVIWQTRTPLKTYGQGVVDLVKIIDSNPHIIDTTAAGRRIDMLPLVAQIYQDFDAEAVCIISNPTMTKQLVYDLESRGFPAYGPIFDS